MSYREWSFFRNPGIHGRNRLSVTLFQNHGSRQANTGLSEQTFQFYCLRGCYRLGRGSTSRDHAAINGELKITAVWGKEALEKLEPGYTVIAFDGKPTNKVPIGIPNMTCLSGWLRPKRWRCEMRRERNKYYLRPYFWQNKKRFICDFRRYVFYPCMRLIFTPNVWHCCKIWTSWYWVLYLHYYLISREGGNNQKFLYKFA